MKIGFAPVSTVEVKHTPLLIELEQKLNAFFQSRSYGEDLKELYINVIAVSPRLERFFKPQHPRYISQQKNGTQSPSLSKALKCWVKLNYERFNNADTSEAKEMLKHEVLNSLTLFDRFKNKISDFNAAPFRQDMKQFFEEVAV